MNSMNLKAKRRIGLALILVCALIGAATAVGFYEQQQSIITQDIKNVADITTKNPALPNLEEGQSATYTSTTVTDLGDAADVTTYKPAVVLTFSSSDISALTAKYSQYEIVIKYAAIPTGTSTHTVGQVAATITMASPNPASITLDLAGNWQFDYEISVTTPPGISADTSSTATVIVTASPT